MVQDYSVYEPGKNEKIVIGIALAVFLGAIGELFYGTWLMAAITPLLYIPVKRIVSELLAKKRLDELRREFRDVLTSLASSFSSGLHMRDALKEAEPAISKLYGDDSVFLKELVYINTEIDDGRIDIDVMRDLAERADVEEITLFTEVYGTCRETGGDIISVMYRTAGMIEDKMRIEEDIRSITKQRKIEGAVITAMPVVILLFLRVISPSYVGILYGNITGIVIMTVAALGTIYAYHMIRKITKVRI